MILVRLRNGAQSMGFVVPYIPVETPAWDLCRISSSSHQPPHGVNFNIWWMWEVWNRQFTDLVSWKKYIYIETHFRICTLVLISH